ncbi:MAG: hypothetical protein K6G88_07205 [Lachnospiraceae bacterium]|nr:hypothetical protein [Lachnospiraceae bacterium]
MKNKRNKKKQIRNLKKGKTKSLGLFETLVMKHAGWSDGRKNLLKCSEEGVWQSSRLKGEIDSYEEYCGVLFGQLKVESEDVFNDVNMLLDKTELLQKNLVTSQKELEAELAIKTNVNERKFGEEELTDEQIVARRTREHNNHLNVFRQRVDETKKSIEQNCEEIFSMLGTLGETYDSTCKIANRLFQHCQRRVDVYWRSALRQNDSLPPIPNVIFTKNSEEQFGSHYKEVKRRGELIKKQLVLSEEEKEV